MPAVPASLDDLRREIDDIDARLHDLLMQRASVVEQVGAAKALAGSAGAFMRPGREAQILRRLLARHQGSLPAATVAALWRTLMTEFLRMQGPLDVAVWPGSDDRTAAMLAFWDLGRSHFGPDTPMMLHDSAHQAIRAVSERPGVVAVLPTPDSGEVEPWWPLLFADGAPRIVARLPFAWRDDGHGRPPSAVVVGAFEAEASGEDHAYIGIGLAGSASRTRLTGLLEQVGFDGHIVATVGEGAASVHLAEVTGHVAADDRRLQSLASAGEGVVDRALVLGGFASQMVLEPAAPRA
jgi:chorismate mutase / prephenate dehydratase